MLSLFLCYAMCADVIIVLKPQEILCGGKDHSGHFVKCSSALEIDGGVGGNSLLSL